MRLVRFSIIATLSLQMLVVAPKTWAQMPPEIMAAQKKRLAALNVSLNKKLTVDQQKKAYAALTEAEYKAYKAAKEKYPPSGSMDNMMDRSNYERLLTQQNRTAVFGTFHITGDEGNVLESNGDKHRWPAPPRRDPSQPHLKLQ